MEGDHVSVTPKGIVARYKEAPMRRLSTLLIATPVMFGLLAAPAAHAEWRGGEGGYPYRGGGYPAYPHHGHDGRALLGALIGLGTAAVIGGIIASQPRHYQPPAVYAPQPGYYPAPAYEQPAYQPSYRRPGYPVYQERGYPSSSYPTYRGTEDEDAE